MQDRIRENFSLKLRKRFAVNSVATSVLGVFLGLIIPVGFAADAPRGPIPTKDTKKDSTPAVPKSTTHEEANKDPANDSSKDAAASVGKVLKELAFLRGTWTGRSKTDAYVEEYWSAEQGDSMVGHCRMIKDGKTNFYELLAIVKLPESIVMRIKHLNGEFVAWNEKDEAGDLKLINTAANEATFDNGNKVHHVKVVYRKTDAKSMHVDVEDTQDGKTNNYPFDYKSAE